MIKNINKIYTCITNNGDRKYLDNKSLKYDDTHHLDEVRILIFDPFDLHNVFYLINEYLIILRPKIITQLPVRVNCFVGCIVAVFG